MILSMLFPFYGTFYNSLLSQGISFTRHLRFLIRSADALINTPASPAALRNRATASDTRMDSMEASQTSTNKQVLINSAKIEEQEDGNLNES
jgi:hypothetical protein